MTLKATPLNRVPPGWRRSEEDEIKGARIELREEVSALPNHRRPGNETLGFASPKPVTPVNSGSGRIQKILLTPASVYFEDAPIWSRAYEDFFFQFSKPIGT